MRKKHADPHFNAEGGCICRCRRCLNVRLEEHNGHVDIKQKCCCRRCNEQCPTEGRAVFATIRAQ